MPHISPPVYKHRDSNMELFRIVAMFLVLLIHADNLSLGAVHTADIHTHPTESFLRIAIYSFSVVCVNSFVLLSGWYGIRPRMERLCSLLFQVLFICGVSLTCYLLLTSTQPTKEDFLSLLLFSDEMWFVRCYLLLYLFSPALNSVVSAMSRHQLALALCLIYGFQTLYGWWHAVDPWTNNGYSPLSFMMLYLLAQYLRKYPFKATNLSARVYFLCFLLMVLLGAVVNYYWLQSGKNADFQWLSSASPIVILSSVFLLLCFSKLSFKSRFINWVGRSCFAVYLCHCTYRVIGFYSEQVKSSYDHQRYWEILLIILFFFVVAIALDQIRILVWNRISSYLFRKKANSGK